MKRPTLLLAAVLAPGCGSLAPGPSLESSAWRVEDIDNRGVLDQARSTLEFRDGRVSGSAACNRYSASMTMSGERLRAGNTITTRMACSPAIMEQEQRFLASLAATRTYRLDGGALYLLDEHTAVRMRLVRQ